MLTNSAGRCQGVFLSGCLTGINGQVIQDDVFLICFNAHHEPGLLPCLLLGINPDGNAFWTLPKRRALSNPPKTFKT